MSKQTIDQFGKTPEERLMAELIIEKATDHKIIKEALRRANRMLNNPGASSELFLYKLAELKRAIEQVKIHL